MIFHRQRSFSRTNELCFLHKLHQHMAGLCTQRNVNKYKKEQLKLKLLSIIY